jgi:hypothetical protein
MQFFLKGLVVMAKNLPILDSRWKKLSTAPTCVTVLDSYILYETLISHCWRFCNARSSQICFDFTPLIVYFTHFLCYRQLWCPYMYEAHGQDRTGNSKCINTWWVIWRKMKDLSLICISHVIDLRVEIAVFFFNLDEVS